MGQIELGEVRCAASSIGQLSETDIEKLLAQLDWLKLELSRVVQPPDPEIICEAAAGRLAAEILRARRWREKLFGSELFGEPAWDILLELYVAGRGGKKLSVSGACYASAVPLTTALRWIQRLEKDGWICRDGDPHDGRRSWLMLTEHASEKMGKFFGGLAARQR